MGLSVYLGWVSMLSEVFAEDSSFTIFSLQLRSWSTAWFEVISFGILGISFDFLCKFFYQET